MPTMLAQQRWILALAGTTLLSLTAAWGLRSQIEAQLEPPVEVDPGPRGRSDLTPSELPDSDPGPLAALDSDGGRDSASATVGGRDVEDYVWNIVRRSLFNSETVDQYNPLPPVATGDDDDDDPELGGPRPAVVDTRSDLPYTLQATSITDPRRFSSAVLADASAAKGDVYNIDSELGADATIRDIEWRRIIIQRSSGAWEYIPLGEEAPPGAATPEPQQQANRGRQPARPPRTGSHVWEGIREVGENHWEIDQAEIDYALANLDRMSREARAVPSFDNGEPNGWKVFSIRRNSIFSTLGLRNNDVIRSVNGQDLSNIQDVASIYSRLLNEKNFQLEVLRRGEPVSFTFDVR